ncbi:hypothetical protein [Candidatus Nitrosotenuis aquarius]|uniref:hypothetical protein n=1 Tax=Candidatus Nitrosotenuis aquarius TaxID=1846278 RepID=UPI0013C3193C|nr:hypothetical protein [Candidatus Nitrosotenuis aquarius]
MKQCKTCGEQFDGNAREFCSWQCEENHVKSLRKKLDDAVKTDRGHTQKLSKQ